MDTTTAAHQPTVGEIVEGMKAKLARENPGVGARRKLQSLLTQEAENAYKTQQYEAALVAWAKLLAVLESHTKLVWRQWLWGEGADDSEHRASCLANIGAALHQRGDGQEAIAYYEQAVSAFEEMGTPRMTWVLYGNVNTKRADYLRKRILEVRNARPVDPASYLDGYGREKQFTPAEMAGAERGGLLSWVSPRAWYTWAFDSAGRPNASFASLDAQSAA